jgi:Fic family protein
MVYIYKKRVGGKNYYYLRASRRLGGKQVTKDIAYLGSTIEEARKNLPIIAQNKQEMKKSYRRISLLLETEYYNNKIKKLKLKKDDLLGNNLEVIEASKSHYSRVFQKFDRKSREEILEGFSVEFAYNTASLEGNTITLEEAKSFFEEGRTPKDRTLREIYDLRNTKDTLFWLFAQKKNLGNDLIIEVHKRLMKDIDERTGYRTRDVRVFRSHFEASSGIYVKTDMGILLKWYNENKKKLHPFVLAVIFHHKFEKVHPFFDGNGRVGRMLMNYILIMAKYPPIVIYRKHRNDYLDALGSVDRISLTKTDKGYRSLINYVASEASSYWNLFL